jgi:hypothetical protein
MTATLDVVSLRPEAPAFFAALIGAARQEPFYYRFREGFRTPAHHRRIGHDRPASETLHESGHSRDRDQTAAFDS